ncbi:thioredoxin-disulfide reductase [Candidatus Micrarchaeota archaeon CG10_big_fil_rev_8_21_14_0_10_45_29]|nr:MAG: thioredoxin-disulfide reductase [Candidatus Micrarchaeota archaeon CG10_big_fil_rev_8_21_14_0_10_45_29]
MPDSDYDVAIIGAGCAGLGAGMYAGRFGLKTVVLGELPGGTITQTHLVENYPAFTSISGLELGTKLLEHAKASDAQVNMEKVMDIEKEKDGSFHIKTDTANYSAKAIIIATGTEWKKLGVPGEAEFANKGVHYCALCDGGFYKGKKIAVVGSGDSAVKESLLLAEFGSEVNILVRGDKIKGEPINNKRAMENKKIKIFTNVEVEEIIGEEKVTKLRLTRPISAQEGAPKSDELETDAVFVMVGHLAKTELASKLGVNLSPKGEIIIDKMSKTNVEGIFAAGDCCDTAFKQAIISAAEGVSAAFSANEYIRRKG